MPESLVVTAPSVNGGGWCGRGGGRDSGCACPVTGNGTELVVNAQAVGANRSVADAGAVLGDTDATAYAQHADDLAAAANAKLRDAGTGLNPTVSRPTRWPRLRATRGTRRPAPSPGLVFESVMVPAQRMEVGSTC
jgi:hypothetical protein